jgi:hypothetical protein
LPNLFDKPDTTPRVDEIKRGSLVKRVGRILGEMALALGCCRERQLQGINIPEAKLDSQMKMCSYYHVWTFGVDFGVDC